MWIDDSLVWTFVNRFCKLKKKKCNHTKRTMHKFIKSFFSLFTLYYIRKLSLVPNPVLLDLKLAGSSKNP